MSSESESSLPVESEALPVDNKHIINEVAKRPALYDKTIKQYSDRNVKAKLWLEVYQNVCRDWHILTDTERKYRGNTIQKKWKNMKDSFAKELAAQEGKSGQAAPAKKKKYVHFDSMLFLIPSMKKRETTSNVSSPTPTQHSEAILSTASTPANNSKEHLQSANNSTDYEQQLLDILRGKNDDDEEKIFALMLVPMLRKLNDDQKHYAKVEILNVLKKAKTLSTMQSPQYKPLSTFIISGFDSLASSTDHAATIPITTTRDNYF
ncbi:uncharacterized protein LOC134654778 [Cydia amplana]|uniref:uncharacterized protein LOC134654778 n=1 Tax=Cydia amplana TaxID=1869771 RepID=UPI002FE5B67A